MLFEQHEDRKLDRTIPTRRVRLVREHEQVNGELIRAALQAESATEAVEKTQEDT